MKPIALVRLLAATVGMASPVAANDAELDRLDREYQTQRQSAVRPLLETYVERLRSLHASMAQRQDPRAAAVKAELDKATAQLEAPAGATPKPPTAAPPPPANTTKPAPAASPTVELRGPKAVFAGGAALNDKGGVAIQFRSAEASATWQVPEFKPGRFRVRIDCGCPAGLGAIAQVRFGNRPPQSLTVLPTSESGQAVAFNFGEIQLPAGVTTVKVTMLGPTPRTKGSGGFNLHLISISPVEPQSP
jgi:hypothetical protein